MPSITDSCSCIHILGCKLSLFRLCDGDFRITPVDGITIGIICAAFCFHIAHISFANSWYLFCVSVIVLARLCVFRIAMSIKKAFFIFREIYDSTVRRYRLSVIMLRFQYSMKLSLSSTLAGVYL